MEKRMTSLRWEVYAPGQQWPGIDPRGMWRDDLTPPLWRGEEENEENEEENEENEEDEEDEDDNDEDEDDNDEDEDEDDNDEDDNDEANNLLFERAYKKIQKLIHTREGVWDYFGTPEGPGQCQSYQGWREVWQGWSDGRYLIRPEEEEGEEEDEDDEDQGDNDEKDTYTFIFFPKY